MHLSVSSSSIMCHLYGQCKNDKEAGVSLYGTAATQDCVGVLVSSPGSVVQIDHSSSHTTEL